MDWTEFDERRVTGFKTVRRGYDPDEVDRFLEDVAGWLQTDAAEELGDRVVEHKVAAAGQSTARVLLIAEQEAQELRHRTEEECADLRAKADAAANEAAARIVKVAKRQAEEEAQQMIDDAREQARAALLDETERRRAEVDAIVDELERRRSAAVEQVERLRAELLSAIAKDSPRDAPIDGDRGTGQRRHAPAYGGSKHANA